MGYAFNPFTGTLDNTGTATTVTTVDTKANILALTPSNPQTAFATDTSEFYVYDGSVWKVASLKLSTELENPDMGSADDSDKLGYSKEYFTDKDMHNVTLKGNQRPENGAIRVDTSQTPNRFQVYLRDKWNTYYDDFTIENNDLRHTPLNEQIYVWRGDSVKVGLNGKSIIQEYQVSMGAYPAPRIIDGGSF